MMNPMNILPSILLALCLLLLPGSTQAEPVDSHPRILFLSSYSYDWESIPRQLAGFNQTIAGAAKVDYVFMDAKKRSTDEAEANAYAQVRYELDQGHRYDVVVLADDAALDFAEKYRQELFAGLPIVFDGINTEAKARAAVQDPLVTGIVESFPMRETIEFAGHVMPKASRIVAITDDTVAGQGALAQYQSYRDSFPELDFEVLDVSTMTEAAIQDTLGSYGEDTILLFLMMTRNVDGMGFSQRESAAFISSAAAVPVFKSDELGIGDGGLLGGVVLSYEEMGAKAARIALQILAGQAPADIPLTTMEFRPMIDEAVLDRYQLSYGFITPETVLLNHRETFWEQYHRILVPTGLIILFLIIMLVRGEIWKRYRQKYFAKLREKDLLMRNLLKTVPGGFATYQLEEGQIKLLYCSEGVALMGGWSIEEFRQMAREDIITRTVWRDDIPHMREAIRKATADGSAADLVFRMRSKGGSYVWVQLSGIPVRRSGNGWLYYAVYAKLSSQTLHYRSILADSPAGVYICDTKTYTMLYANRKALEIFGCKGPYTGRKCYEYLCGQAKPCAWCPMDRMSRNSYYNVESDTPDGQRHMLMSGKIIDWNGLRAHIEFVTDNTYRYKVEQRQAVKQRYQLELLSRMSGRYVGSYHLNLTRGTVEHGLHEGRLGKFSQPMPWRSFLRYIRRFLYGKQEIRRYYQTFNRRYLLDCFHDGQDKLSLEHHAGFTGQGPRWYRSTVVMTQNPETGDVEGYIYAEDIHEEKIRSMLLDRSLWVNQDKLMCIDIQKDAYILFDDEHVSKPKYVSAALQTLQACLNANSPAGMAEAVLEKLHMDTILKVLDQKDSYTIFYSLETAEGLRHKQAVFSYLEREFGLLALRVTDVTDAQRQREDHQQRLEKALSEARAANAAKTDFLSRMSHDMRTPMNGILGLSYMMEQQEDVATIHAEIGKLRETGEYLLQLINDVLDVNKMESGRLELHPQKYEGKKVFEAVIAMVRPQMEKKGIRFRVETKGIVWQKTMMDAQRVKQIFVNLLSNATKFTPDGGQVEVLMEQTAQDEDKVCNRFVIRDTGIGMSSEFLPRVFQPFSQENRLGSSQGGTGLGLSIVKNLVELMGGRIEVESRLDEGTTFTLYLDFPLAEPAAADEPEAGIVTAAGGVSGMKVLLCEDNELNAQIATWMLEQFGCQVTWRENGELGVAAFRDAVPGTYDIVLMDIQMPVMDGLSAARCIRALDRPDAAVIPIVAMTANAYAEDIANSLAAGMNEHLAKPINPEGLRQVLTRYAHWPE